MLNWLRDYVQWMWGQVRILWDQFTFLWGKFWEFVNEVPKLIKKEYYSIRQWAIDNIRTPLETWFYNLRSWFMDLLSQAIRFTASVRELLRAEFKAAIKGFEYWINQAVALAQSYAQQAIAYANTVLSQVQGWINGLWTQLQARVAPLEIRLNRLTSWLTIPKMQKIDYLLGINFQPLLDFIQYPQRTILTYIEDVLLDWILYLIAYAFSDHTTPLPPPPPKQ